MKLEEIKNSNLQPFSDFITVKEGKDEGFIDDKYHSIFYDKCQCGSDMMIRLVFSNIVYTFQDIQNNVKHKPSITAVTCCNLNCHLKIVYQLDELFQRFDIKGLGPAVCERVVLHHKKKYGEVSVATIIKNRDINTGLVGAEYDNWVEAMNIIYGSKQSLGNLIYKLAFTGIGSKFEDVFQGYSNMKEFAIDVVPIGLTNFLANKSIKSTTTQYYFCTYFRDIVQIATSLEHTHQM